MFECNTRRFNRLVQHTQKLIMFGSACDQSWQLGVDPSGVSNALLAECNCILLVYLTWLLKNRCEIRGLGSSFFNKQKGSGLVFFLKIIEEANLCERSPRGTVDKALENGTCYRARVFFREGSRAAGTSGHCSIRGWAYFTQAVRIFFRNSWEGSLKEFLPAK